MLDDSVKLIYKIMTKTDKNSKWYRADVDAANDMVKFIVRRYVYDRALERK